MLVWSSPRAVPTRTLLAALAGLALLGLAALALTPSGQAAAAAFLGQFRVQRFAVVTYDPQALGRPYIDLTRLGTVETQPPGELRASRVASLAEASARVGFTVRPPARLPAGASAAPTVQVSQPYTYRFTFDQEKARAYLASIGERSFALPPKFHGATLTITVPAAAVLQYQQADGTSALYVVQMRSPTVQVAGNVMLAELRDFLLSVPGLPRETVSQLRAIEDWTTTLPVPVPKGQAHWREVQVQGAPGLIVADNTGLGGGVLWVRAGVLTALAGPLTERELLETAASI